MSNIVASNMTTTLAAKLAQRFGLEANPEVLDILKATAFKGQVSDAQMSALLVVATQYSLNPFTKEIYAFPDSNNGIVPVVGVDGWARIINENPQFDGMEFTQDDEQCTCTIYRKDRTRPVSVTEYMSECKRGTKPWQSHPKRMLRHKAMIQCARMAFGYTGIYDQDEAERIVDMGAAQEVRKTAVETAREARPTAERTERHAGLIKELEFIAQEGGQEALAKAWGGGTLPNGDALSAQDRKAIGAEELARLKSMAGTEDVNFTETHDE
ncbi:phage recombination protein Bet [Burkholderia cenocepacia]|uniref:phage recombination protein Bet n=1 Tax=Burkholderia cenocepacia TaxID=95486 RepID=UPI003C13015B